MLTEFAFGAVVLAVTAALVVSPPGVSRERSTAAAAFTAPPAVVDRVLSSATGQIRLQIERSKESTGSLITVMPLDATNPQRVTVRIGGLLRETRIDELALDATSSGYRGNIELPVNTAVRLQVILDNDEASSFVATPPPLD